MFLRLPEIAEQCKFTSKLESFLTRTPVLQFIQEGGECQKRTPDACIARTIKIGR